MKKIYLLSFLGVLFFFIIGAPASAQWISAKGNLPTGGTDGFYSIDALDENIAVCTGNPSGGGLPYQNVWLTTDGGTTWNCIHTESERYNGTICITMSDANHIWCSTTKGRIYATSDGGTTWVTQFNDSTKTTYMNFIKMFDSNNGIAMGDNPVFTNPALFLKTTNGGTTWVSTNTTSFGGASVNNFYPLSFLDPLTGFFYAWDGTNCKLMKTTDAGYTWSERPRPTSGSALGICFYDTSIGLCGPAGVPINIARTFNGSATWETYPSIQSNVTSEFEFIPGDPSKVWASDVTGTVVFSADTGRTWSTQMTQKIRQIVFKTASIGWMCGKGEFVYKTTNGGGTAVTTEPPFTRPAEFLLRQNHPNPFNPETVIQYELRSESLVRLVIYDLLGREVATLVDKKMPAGSHQASWSAKNLASGMYFYRMEAVETVNSSNRFRDTKKMMVLK